MKYTSLARGTVLYLFGDFYLYLNDKHLYLFINLFVSFLLRVLYSADELQSAQIP